MASGRMITNLICRDKRVHQLSSDTSRLAFTWLITFADSEGRTPGDPAVVRSMLFPRREDVTIEQMEAIISEWHSLGLAVWYEAEGDLWIWFPGFEKNQPGLRKDRETPSKIPPPPVATPDQLRSDDGVTPELLRIKGREEKRKEENRREGKGENPPATVQPGAPASTFDALKDAAESKGIMLTPEDVSSVNELVKQGVTNIDVINGIAWLVGQDPKRAVCYFRQVVGPARTAMSKRKQTGIKEMAYPARQPPPILDMEQAIRDLEGVQ